MTRVLVPLVAATLLVGCARVLPSPPAPERVAPEPAALLAKADELARQRSPQAARTLYRKVLRTYRGTPAAAEALHGLGHLYVDPESPLHDWATANVAFGLLATEYPESRHVAEARAWRAALGELLRNQADAKRLRADLQRLKELDMEEEHDE